MADDATFANRIFLNAALPLLKPLVAAKPGLSKAFSGKEGVVQVSALVNHGTAGSGADGAGKVGTHFLVSGGALEVVRGVHPSPTIELEFPGVEALNAFFAGKSKKLPRIRGAFKAPGMLVATFKALLTMAAFLGAKDPPAAAEDRELLVKLYFYLLSSGISQLNKAGHPKVAKWAASSPDRVYAWEVAGRPELSAHLRVKAGNSRAARGTYERSKPFFTMSFDSVDSALGILLEKDDMIEATTAGRIRMLGAPEFGSMLGELMQLVGGYAK